MKQIEKFETAAYEYKDIEELRWHMKIMEQSQWVVDQLDSEELIVSYYKNYSFE